MITEKYILRINIILLCLLVSKLCFSQDYNWWNIKHNWDGVTHWSDYIITSPAFMGPNALPVPEINNGSFKDKAYLKFALEKHSGLGDQTENIYLEGFSPFYNNKIGIKLYVVPIEHFKMDTITRDVRKARSYNGEGVAGGDIYLCTYFQIVKDRSGFPDVLLTLNLKTASGRNLKNARYTDSSGYFFDLSFGKSIALNHYDIKYFKPYAMIGFYCWQMHGVGQFQNDAFLYGIGSDILLPKFDIKNSLGGFIGYKNNGDRPMVIRLQFQSKFETMVNYELMLQQGLNDFKYLSIRMACVIDINNIVNNLKFKD